MGAVGLVDDTLRCGMTAVAKRAGRELARSWMAKPLEMIVGATFAMGSISVSVSTRVFSTEGRKAMNRLSFDGVEWSVLASSGRVIEHCGEI